MAAAYTAAAIAVVLIVAQPRAPAQEQPEPITDAVAYEIYAVVVPPAWVNVRPKGTTLLLQQETERAHQCAAPPPDGDGWEAVERNFRDNNSGVKRLLQSMVRLDVPFRLIPRAEIEADDARLALKYPGIWQRRPESMDFVAVSAVGFNPEKTKAAVYVRGRSSGATQFLELSNGEWVSRSGRCYWIA